MVIDTSAIAAILFDEPERANFIEKIEATQTRLISAGAI
jgi:ribonuclease VapC